MRNMWLIIRREYLERVRTRSFLVLTLLLPAIMAMAFVLPLRLASMSVGRPEHLVLVVSSQRFGEAVHAVVQTRTEVTGDELVAHCRLTIAGYKVPRGIDLRAEPLPKSGAGKILKRELRDAWWQGRETRI